MVLFAANEVDGGGSKLVLHGIHLRFIFLNVEKDAFPVVKEMDQGSMDVGQGEMRKIGDNFFGRLALKLMPHVNILYADASSFDAWFAAAGVRCSDDVFSFDCGFHRHIVPHSWVRSYRCSNRLAVTVRAWPDVGRACRSSGRPQAMHRTGWGYGDVGSEGVA